MSDDGIDRVSGGWATVAIGVVGGLLVAAVVALLAGCAAAGG